MSKYHSRKTTVDGITFDSAAEAHRYCELRIMQKAGLIKNLGMQPEFELIPAYKKDGKTVRRTVYKADFVYVDTATGKAVIEDVKGMKTPVYKLKKKLLEYQHPDITIKEITR